MTKSINIVGAAVLVVAGVGIASAQSNISQSQSGSSNSQSISIGNVDGNAPPAKKKKGKKVDSTQEDSATGNTQSVNADGGGNISQNQSGRNNAQSINIGPGVKGTPSVTQTQTGADKKQSVVVDGKKVEKKQE